MWAFGPGGDWPLPAMARDRSESAESSASEVRKYVETCWADHEQKRYRNGFGKCYNEVQSDIGLCGHHYALIIPLN
jgi:hypothetical protein